MLSVLLYGSSVYMLYAILYTHFRTLTYTVTILKLDTVFTSVVFDASIIICLCHCSPSSLGIRPEIILPMFFLAFGSMFYSPETDTLYIMEISRSLHI